MGFDDNNCTVFVKNVEARVTEEILWELFLQAGPLANVKIPINRETGERRGNYAFVTYREEISVPYACELFNQIKLFKKPIYCNPSNRDRNGSITQSPGSTPGTPNTPGSPQSPASGAKNLIQGILNRSNPQQTSTPYHGKRKLSVDGESRVVIIDDDERSGGRYDDRSGGDRMYNRGRDSGGRYDQHDDRGRNNDRYDNNDRSRGYERNNSFNSSYGNSSPMHMQAMNQSHRQYNGRPGNSPRGGGGNDFGRSPRDFQRGDTYNGRDGGRGFDRNPRQQQRRSHNPY